jgi:DNA polymerase
MRLKHFKFTPTGKRRLHQSPDAGDIAYYRPFLLREIGIVARSSWWRWARPRCAR